MGTSNWQHIPFCVDALMKIAPLRFLDVGVGFGRWGIVAREFCDVWFNRVLRKDWKVHVEGIEGFAENIDEYHRSFYNHIHIGDARAIIPTLPGPWDVVMFGDVLEHFERDAAERILNHCLDTSKYVIVSIPLGEDWEQGALYGNEFERHLSEWSPEDFQSFCLVRRAVFRDFRGRPHGSFVMSRHDPRGLRNALFSLNCDAEEYPVVASAHDELDRATERVAELAHELRFTRTYSTHRWAQRLRATSAWNALRWIHNRNHQVATVRALGSRHAASSSSRVRLLHAAPDPAQRPIPWDFLEFDPAWSPLEDPGAPYGRCYESTSGRVRVPVGDDPVLTFASDPAAGIVEVKFRGSRHVVDLYSPTPGFVSVRPLHSPPYTPVPRGPAGGGAGPLTPPVHVPLAPPDSIPDPDAEAAWRCAEDRARSFRDRSITTVAIHCPHWMGITSATRNLFTDCYPLPPTRDTDPYFLSTDDLERHARILLDAGVRHAVFSGGDEVQFRLAQTLTSFSPSFVVDMLWHGSYLQCSEDYAWKILQMWTDAARARIVRRIGVVKKGMEDFFRAIGADSAFVLNRVDAETLDPPDLPDDEAHIGIWISHPGYRKLPHAMISALTLIPGARLHSAGLDPRSSDMVRYFSINAAAMNPAPLPHDQLLAAIRRTHLSMYVTFSECCPMLPLESLSQGVPCLTGPTSHLFEDHDYLRSRLVVPEPDRADTIARFARVAIAERRRIVEEYRAYVPQYNQASRRSVEAFLA